LFNKGPIEFLTFVFDLTYVKKWKKRLLARVRIVGPHFEQFYCRQLKNGQLGEMSAKVLKM